MSWALVKFSWSSSWEYRLAFLTFELGFNWYFQPNYLNGIIVQIMLVHVKHNGMHLNSNLSQPYGHFHHDHLLSLIYMLRALIPYIELDDSN